MIDSTVTQVAGDQHTYIVQLPAGTKLPRGGVQALATGNWLVWPQPGQQLSNLRARNRRFVGREDLLTELDADFDQGPGERVPSARAIHGLGGVGKTELAVEYVYRQRDRFEVRWWIDAEQPLTIPAQLGELAIRLGLPETNDLDAMVSELLGVLASRDRWLLVFDNATNVDEVQRWWPDTSAGGRVLVTSRNPAWGILADPIEVDTLPEPEAVEYLLVRTGDKDHRAATELARELGGLPLALEQAAAYIEVTGLSTSDYVTTLREQPARLLAQRMPTLYQRSVQATFQLAFDQAAHQDPAAAELLTLCALLAPDPIPLLLLAAPWQMLLPLPLSLARALAAGRLDEVVGVLRQLSLSQRERDYVHVHPLVQHTVRHRLDSSAERQWVGVAVRLLERNFPDDSDDVLTWTACQTLLPHAITVADHAQRLDMKLDRLASLLNQAASYLQNRAQFAPARILFERALAIDEAVFGPDHPSIARDCNNLGGILQNLGDLTGARTHLERALAIAETALGSDHPILATVRSNLGDVLHDLGDLVGARTHLERALAVAEAASGADDLSVAAIGSNLGSVLQDLGDPVAARPHYERALTIAEAALDPNHPTIARYRSNLGSVLEHIGDPAAARTHLERALAIHEAAFGPDHPIVASNCTNLGMVLKDLGDPAAARTHLERALAINEAIHGPDHPRGAIVRNNLGGVLKDLGDLTGARAQLEHALAIATAALGTDHPTVSRIRKNLGMVLRDLGDPDPDRQATTEGC